MINKGGEKLDPLRFPERRCLIPITVNDDGAVQYVV
jgi:hypothetical protein